MKMLVICDCLSINVSTTDLLLRVAHQYSLTKGNGYFRVTQGLFHFDFSLGAEEDVNEHVISFPMYRAVGLSVTFY